MADVKFDYGTLTVRQHEPPHDDQFGIGIGSPDCVTHGVGEDRKYLLVSGYMPAKYARLFAASPDLYEALKDCVEALSYTEAGPRIDAARAALAKARGES